ncbi:MAG: phasin family protein, partial [Planctomycetes bacterium]|nr:phasin family protein [Planctomycetota bacterium]
MLKRVVCNSELDEGARGYRAAGKSVIPKEDKMTKQVNKAAKSLDVDIPDPFAGMAGLNGSMFEIYAQTGQAILENAFALNQEMMRFAGERFQADVEAVQTLSQCTNWQDMAEFQSNFTRSAAEVYQAEISKLMERGMEATAAT